MDWESVLSEGHKFLDEVSPLVQEGVEFGFLSFVVKGSLRVKVAVVAVLLVSSSRLELR